MKAFTITLLLLIGMFFGFLYLHSKSIDRAHFVNALNSLKNAQKEMSAQGSFTVHRYTNQILVAGASLTGQLAVESDGLAHLGRLVLASDGSFVWIDKTQGSTVVSSRDQKIIFPARFRSRPF